MNTDLPLEAWRDFVANPHDPEPCERFVGYATDRDKSTASRAGCAFDLSWNLSMSRTPVLPQFTANLCGFEADLPTGARLRVSVYQTGTYVVVCQDGTEVYVCAAVGPVATNEAIVSLVASDADPEFLRSIYGRPEVALDTPRRGRPAAPGFTDVGAHSVDDLGDAADMVRRSLWPALREAADVRHASRGLVQQPASDFQLD